MFALGPMFIGSHFWLAPIGVAFTSPSADNVTQDGVWPDEDEDNWEDWTMGICESADIDPKYGPMEQILQPSPGAVQARDIVIPYGIPEIKMTMLTTSVLAMQLALNTQQLFATNTLQFNPNGGGGPGLRGILKCQQYDHNNVLKINWQSWAFVQLASPLKAAPKTMTKPEYLVTLLASANNTGTV